MYVSLMERKGIEQEKMETAKRMLERGMPVSLIIDLTGLTEEVILSLKSED